MWNLDNLKTVTLEEFRPSITEDERDVRYERWSQALKRSFEWNSSKKGEGISSENVSSASANFETERNRRLYASIPAAVYLFSSFLLCKLADSLQ